MISKLAHQTVKKLKLEVIEVSHDTNYPTQCNQPIETFTNRSFKIGPKIIIGLYQNPELEEISFWHEIGHTLVTDTFMESVNYNHYDIEMEAWFQGLQLAYSLNCPPFTPTAIQWALQQAETYIK